VDLLQKATFEAVEQEGLDLYDTPQVTDGEFSEEGRFTFKATIPLPPRVELGEYKGLKITREMSPVTDGQVAGRLEELREIRAEFAAVQPRPLQHEDIAWMEIQQEDTDPEPRRVRVKVGDNIAEFDEGIKGMLPGEERDVEINYAADHPEPSMAGTTAKVHAKLIEIQERKLPELNDEFAQRIGEYSGVDELRADVRRSMEKAVADAADRRTEEQLIEEIVKRSTISFPEVMKERGVAERLQDFLADLKKNNLTLDEYLDRAEQTMEGITEGFERAAERGIKVGLALVEIADREGIQVEDADLEAELAKMAEERGTPVESIRAYLDRTEGMQAFRNGILQRKILDFLVHASNIRNVEPKGDTRR